MIRIFYIPILIVLNFFVGFVPWGGMGLAGVIALTYIAFPPDRVFHPTNMLFAYYALYVVLSCSLNFFLDMIGWDYILPWGQTVFWDTFQRYTLFQIELTFLVLYFSLYRFSQPSQKGPVATTIQADDYPDLNEWVIYATVGASIFLVVLFIQATAGIVEWLTDYSTTYLSKREGYGLLNVTIAPVGTAAVFLLGIMAFKAERKVAIWLSAIALIAILSFPAGFKSRLIFLLIVFLAPYFININFSFKWVWRLGLAFFSLLYLALLVRTSGFYASPAYFMEMLIGYFNSYQLHDWIVVSRDPAWFSTSYQLLVKPMQILGMAGNDENFDISVMLTKEFFPDQWDVERATQQWPLETELYLNYYGNILAPLPLMLYAGLIGWLYRSSILRVNIPLIPVYILEFQRLFSTMRGTLIPWETPIYIGQYILVYLICRLATRGQQRSTRQLSDPFYG